MFAPTYTITPQLLDSIKQIAVLVFELNQLVVAETALAQLVSEAEVTAVHASTSIEGNPLPLTEVRRLLKQRPEQVRDSEQEILNYNRALIQLHEQTPATFDADLIRHIHSQVMDSLLPPHQVGRYRQHPVVIHDPRTRDVVFLPPDYGDVDVGMNELLAYIADKRRNSDPIILAGVFHKQFMLIHPFIDGNGRTGRLATKSLLADLGLNFFRLMSFETYYNRNVTRYFQFVGEQGNFYEIDVDFTAWLEYFAGGILDELLRIRQQVQAYAATPQTRLKPHHHAVLAYIEQHGFITDRDYAQLTDRAKATRALDFKQLLEWNLIERHGRGRSTHYRRR